MPTPSWTWTTSEVLPSELGVVATFMERMLAALEAAHWTDHEIFGIRLSVEEALVNAIKHGNRLHPDKQVQVECKLSPQAFWIDIADQGAGFDPYALPDPTAPENLERPNGRGVLLMQNFMTHVCYNAVGNQVTMEKHRAPQKSPHP